MGGHSTTARGQARQYKTRRVQTSVLPRRSSTTIYNSPHMRACLRARDKEIQQNKGASMMGAARIALKITFGISSTSLSTSGTRKIRTVRSKNVYALTTAIQPQPRLQPAAVSTDPVAYFGVSSHQEERRQLKTAASLWQTRARKTHSSGQ